jgi:hypothetical protein
MAHWPPFCPLRKTFLTHPLSVKEHFPQMTAAGLALARAERPTLAPCLACELIVAKTGDSRIDDTLVYLKHKLTPGRFQEVSAKVSALPNKAAVGNTLSIGHHGAGTNARHAKRALMLLATLFVRDHRRADAVNCARALPENSEHLLVKEIDSWFCAPGVDGAAVAREAVSNVARMPKWNNVNYEAGSAVRGVYDASRPFNCYNAIVFWAFQAGAISKRYLWNYLQGNDGNTFFPNYSLVGWELLFDHATKVDTLGTGAVQVPIGRTVYFETPAKVFGHVALSLGDGRCISQNSVMDFLPAALNGPNAGEWIKMSTATTHILPIREMLDHKFRPDNGYPRLKISSGNFWDPIPIAER